MNDDENEDDPFIALSYSESEIKDISDFLNAPSSVVIKDNNPSMNQNNNDHNNNQIKKIELDESSTLDSALFEISSIAEKSSNDDKKNETKVTLSPSLSNTIQQQRESQSKPKEEIQIQPKEDIQFKPQEEKPKRRNGNKRKPMDIEEILAKMANDDDDNDDDGEDFLLESSVSESSDVQTHNIFSSKSKNQSFETINENSNEPQKITFPLDRTPTEIIEPVYDISSPAMEEFEYLFRSYLNASADDMHKSFVNELRSILNSYFSYDKYITDFIKGLEKDINAILEEGYSNFDLPKFFDNEIDVNNDFNKLSEILPQKSDENEIKENENIDEFSTLPLTDKIESTHVAWVANSNSLLGSISENSNNITDIHDSKDNTFHSVFIMQNLASKLLDLETKDYSIKLEKEYIDQKKQNLKNNIESLRDKHYFSMNEYGEFMDSDLTLKDSLNELMEQLKNFDPRMHKSFNFLHRRRFSDYIEELLLMCNQVCLKGNRINRSIEIINRNINSQSEPPPEIHTSYSSQIPTPQSFSTSNYHSQYDPPSSYQFSNSPSEYPIFNPPPRYEITQKVKPQLYLPNFNFMIDDIDDSIDIELPPSKSNFVNNVRQQLTKIRQIRKDQISSIRNLPYDNY